MEEEQEQFEDQIDPRDGSDQVFEFLIQYTEKKEGGKKDELTYGKDADDGRPIFLQGAAQYDN
jgi:hypothetical protein